MESHENYAAPPGFGTFWVWELERLRATPSFEVSPGQLKCLSIGEAEASAMQRLMAGAGNYESNAVLARLAKGRKGYMGELGTAPVTYGWAAFSFEQFGETGVGFAVPTNDAYLYDFATLPQYRGHGYYPTLLRFIVADLAQEGINRVWIGTAPGNDKSARSIGRAGFQKVAHSRFVPGSPPGFELVAVPSVNNELVAIARQGHVAL